MNTVHSGLANNPSQTDNLIIQTTAKSQAKISYKSMFD